MTVEEFKQSWEDESDSILVHTSGSTGKPKPMMANKQRMLNSARITCDFLGLRPHDTALLCMSLDYIAGKMMVVRSIERNLRLISVKPNGHPLSEESLPDGLLQEIGHIDFAAMVPMQVYNSLQVPEERERLTHIRHLIIGGGAIDEALGKELATMPNAIWSTYGMTETLSHIALRRLNGTEKSDWYMPFDSVGVSLNEEGCLVIDAPLVCEHPLVTNDIAEIKNSPHGGKPLFRIKGRKDNVICSGGIKIQIEEVEDALRKNINVPFMIVKKRDEKFGEIGVLLTEGHDLAHIKDICKATLPKYWVPRLFLHTDHLPMTETGKPKRTGWVLN